VKQVIVAEDHFAAMAENTMDAIKKKMQAMKLEKESAFDRADHLEHRLVEQKYIYDQVQHLSSHHHQHLYYT